MARLKLLMAVLIGAIVAVAASAAIGGTPSTTIVGSLTKVRLIRDATEGQKFTTQSTDWVKVPGATTRVRVPNGQQGAILARFASESDCQGTPQGGIVEYCRVRVLVDGLVAQPADPDIGFDAATSSLAGWESHSVERSLGDLAPGLHTVRVQASVTSGSITAHLDAWHLTVERLRT